MCLPVGTEHFKSFIVEDEVVAHFHAPFLEADGVVCGIYAAVVAEGEGCAVALIGGIAEWTTTPDCDAAPGVGNAVDACGHIPVDVACLYQ